MLRAGRQVSVEENRDAEPADLVGDLDRLGMRGGAIGGIEPDDRAYVERADRRVQALMGAHVDRRDRLLGAAGQRVEQGARRAGKGEDSAVVVGVGVAVEQGRPAREGLLQLGDAAGVAPLGNVGDGEQRHTTQTKSSPARTSGSPSISTVGSSTTQSRWTGT